MTEETGRHGDRAMSSAGTTVAPRSDARLASLAADGAADGVPFCSILFERPEGRIGVAERDAPECFADLNLDQIIESVTSARAKYRLQPFFHVPLRDVEAVEHRQEVFQDLERELVRRCIDGSC